MYVIVIATYLFFFIQAVPKKKYRYAGSVSSTGWKLQTQLTNIDGWNLSTESVHWEFTISWWKWVVKNSGWKKWYCCWLGHSNGLLWLVFTDERWWPKVPQEISTNSRWWFQQTLPWGLFVIYQLEFFRNYRQISSIFFFLSIISPPTI